MKLSVKKVRHFHSDVEGSDNVCKLKTIFKSQSENTKFEKNKTFRWEWLSTRRW